MSLTYHAARVSNGILIGTTRQNIGNLAVALFGLASITVIAVWAVREQRRHRRPQLWVLLAASILTYLTDAAARMLTGLQSYPGANGLVVYRAFGIDIAVWMGCVFPAYVGFAGYATYLTFAEGRPRRTLWLILTIGGVADTAGEYIMIHAADLYSYIGRQPLKLFGLPLLWPWAFISAPMLMGATVALLSRKLHGITWLLALPLLGSGYLAYLSALFWPAMVARVTDMSTPLLSIIGLATLGCMLSTLYVLSLFLPAGPGPDKQDREAIGPTARIPTPAQPHSPPADGAQELR
ncbi:hypothetical protein ACFVZ3_06320 [Kitasatospora purpeofusca]|uniref:hypothetical protein n=1 Tax=Kitasatospora purpeofusca TaxID=67352 RepID=UPI0036A67077